MVLKDKKLEANLPIINENNKVRNNYHNLLLFFWFTSKMQVLNSSMSPKSAKQALVMLESFNTFMEPLNKDVLECMLPIGNIPLLDILIHHLYS